MAGIGLKTGSIDPVSYTHLDVYKRQAGLRKDFENIRDRKLQLQNENNITLLHYENLIDVANEN